MAVVSLFRKLPAVIEARQLGVDHDTDCEILRWCGGVPLGEDDGGGKAILGIDTLEGRMLADPGDWIIRGVQGEFYPCKPDIFAAIRKGRGLMLFPKTENPDITR